MKIDTFRMNEEEEYSNYIPYEISQEEKWLLYVYNKEILVLSRVIASVANAYYSDDPFNLDFADLLHEPGDDIYITITISDGEVLWNITDERE